MLEHLRQRAANAFAKFDHVILATCGPSGPQACRVRCQARGTALILCIPRSSDHLFNLEHQQAVVVLTAEWQLHGTVRHVSTATPPEGEIAPSPWKAEIEIQPVRLQFLREDDLTFAETIDF